MTIKNKKTGVFQNQKKNGKWKTGRFEFGTANDNFSDETKTAKKKKPNAPPQFDWI